MQGGFQRGGRGQPRFQGVGLVLSLLVPSCQWLLPKTVFLHSRRISTSSSCLHLVPAEIIRFTLVSSFWSRAGPYTCHCGQGDGMCRIAWLRARSGVGLSQLSRNHTKQQWTCWKEKETNRCWGGN